jgi:hypothetical protein
MVYLELIDNSSPYKFKSLGELDFDKSKFGEYVQSTDFPIGTKYVLTKGKFPLNYNDVFEPTGSHTLNNNIKVKITSFDVFCTEERFKNPQRFPEDAFCRIGVAKVQEKPSSQLSSNPLSTIFKKPFGRKIVPLGGRKSNRRKSNRRR